MKRKYDAVGMMDEKNIEKMVFEKQKAILMMVELIDGSNFW